MPSNKQILKDKVRMFYDRLWNAHDVDTIPTLLHEHFTFRGSLGQEKNGHQGFKEYMDMVHTVLDQYRCIIEDLVAEDSKVFARVTFSGIHQDVLLGFPPSHKRVTWQGFALFTFDDDKILSAWVLGDLKHLEDQLRENSV